MKNLMKTLTNVLTLYGRNQKDWLDKGIIDMIFDMDYEEKLYTPLIDHVHTIVKNPQQVTKLLGNYESNQ